MDGSEWLVSRFDPLDVRLDETHRRTGGIGLPWRGIKLQSSCS